MPNMNDVKKALADAIENLNPSDYRRHVAGCPVIISRAAPTDRPILVNLPAHNTPDELAVMLASARLQAEQIVQTCNGLRDYCNALLASLEDIENGIDHPKTL